MGKLHTKSSKRNAFMQKNKKTYIYFATFLQVPIKFYLIVKKFLTLNKNKLQKFQRKRFNSTIFLKCKQ